VSTFNYGAFVSMANKLIKEFGQVGSLRKPGAATGPAYDPTPGASVDRAAEFAITKFSAMEIDGTRVTSQDKKVLMSVNSLVDDPSTDEQLIEADGTAWSIMNIDAIRPAEKTVLWVLQVRR